jgi:hypothetical protein
MTLSVQKSLQPSLQEKRKKTTKMMTMTMMMRGRAEASISSVTAVRNVLGLEICQLLLSLSREYAELVPE